MQACDNLNAFVKFLCSQSKLRYFTSISRASTKSITLYCYSHISLIVLKKQSCFSFRNMEGEIHTYSVDIYVWENSNHKNKEPRRRERMYGKQSFMVLFLLFLIMIFSSAYVQGIQVNAYQLHSPHIHHPFFQTPLVLCRGHFQADKVHFQVHMALVENSCPIEHYSYHMSLTLQVVFFKLSLVLLMLSGKRICMALILLCSPFYEISFYVNYPEAMSHVRTPIQHMEPQHEIV